MKQPKKLYFKPDMDVRTHVTHVTYVLMERRTQI